VNLTLDLLCKQGLAELLEAVRRYVDFELDGGDELILELLQLSVAQNREELRERAVPNWHVLPDLVGYEQRREKKRSPDGGMQCDFRTLLKPAEVEHTYNAFCHTEPPLVKHAQDE
jgi:hypothetical protein